MKPAYYIIVLLITTLSFPVQGQAELTPQTQTIAEQLQGAWILDFEASMTRVNEKKMAHYNAMDDTRKNRIKQAYSGRELHFNTDGSFTQKLSNGKEIEGQWELKDKQIEVTNAKGSVRYYKIETIENHALVLQPINNQGKHLNMFISPWILTKA